MNNLFERQLWQLGWPQQRPIPQKGGLHWKRPVEPHMRWARPYKNIHAFVTWEGPSFQAQVLYQNDHEETKALDLKGNKSPNNTIEIVAFEKDGLAQHLCTKTAFNQFFGRVTLINTAAQPF